MSKADENGMLNESGVAYAELIRRQRRLKKMSQEELGSLVRVKKNAVGAWEAGRSRPDVSSVPIICEALDMSLEEFFGVRDKERADKGKSGITQDEKSTLLRRFSLLNAYNRQVILRQMEMLWEMQTEEQQPRKVIRLFRNDLAVSAGTGEALEAARGEEVFLFADRIPGKVDEIICVNGDSMEPTYSDGDQVLVRHCSAVRPGEIGVFVCNDTGYLKEYRKDGLYSHNPAYAPISFADGDAVRCIGKVVGKVEEEDWADQESYKTWTEYRKNEQ